MELFAVFALVGSLAGVLAGLLGIGGGIVLVPGILIVLSWLGVAESVAVHMAVGTSLSVIAVTGSSSAYGHWRIGAVNKNVFNAMVPGLVVGAVLGGILADAIPGHYLRRVFGAFVIFVGFRMFVRIERKSRVREPRRYALAASGIVIGVTSALFGVGGGVLSVPWLQYIGVKIHDAIGTSAACGVPIAVFGATTFGIMGRGADIQATHAVGYIFLPAFLALSFFSVPFARLGAVLAHRVPQSGLKKIFGVLLACVGGYLVVQ